MRIASLLPSATEIVCALGLEDQLVAVTHECDFPAGVKRKPVVTASVLTGRMDEADRAVAGLKQRVSTVPRLAGQREPRRVLCLEWIDPLFGSGHWTPEVVELAGGQDLLGNRRQPARRIAWKEIVAAAPDVIVVMACGFSLDRSLQEMPLLEQQPGWEALPAVRRGDVYVVDGNAY